MKRSAVRTGVIFATSALCLAAASRLHAQAATTNTSATAPTDPTTPADANEETIVLSPFTVSDSDSSDGYAVKDTLAGTRVRTEIKDVASALTVINKQFLRDTGAKNSQDLLVYTTNTEVGGVRGNFSGAGGSQTYGESANLLRPNNNTRVRGLDAADNTRDYFLTEIPWDGYNVDRVDMQRGPNSILFGVGSPAGIINTSLNGASFKTAYKVENRIAKHGSMRNSVDLNQSIIKNELALRVAAVNDHTKFQQKPAFNRDRRLFAAVRYEPKLFGENAHTMIRANFEKGDVKANRPRSLPPVDAITPWFLTGKDARGNDYANKVTPDGTRDWTKYTFDAQGNQKVAPWFSYAAMGRSGNPNIGMFYDYNNPSPIRVQSSTPGSANGLNADGTIDGTIGGVDFGTNFALAGYNAFAIQSGIPGGAYYGNKSLSDASIFDFYHNLMDGDNKREYQKWKAGNVSLSQTFFSGRVGLEAVYDMQRYQDGQVGFLNSGEYVLSVDINAKLLDGTANPNVGRPYVGNSGQYGNNENYIDRDSVRLTGFAELRTEDHFGKNLFTRILGRHVLTGLLSEDVKQTDYRGYARWASEPAFAEYNQRPGQKADITTGIRQVDWIAYLGPSLQSKSTASGAQVNRIQTTIAPQQYQSVRSFDSHWNAPASVLPSAPYTYTSYTNTNPANGPIGGPVTVVGTQADNPANYVGWTTKSYRTLSADKGDITSLYTSGQKGHNTIKSEGLTWQGYLLDGAVVPTFGWRKDTVKNYSTQAPKDGFTNVSIMGFDHNKSASNLQEASGTSKSYGIVLHTPRQFRDKLPLGTHLSVFANKSENFKADAPRGDIFGQKISNPKGDTKDYGIVISTLNDKVTLKVTKYETKVENATLTSNGAGFGGNLYYAWALPYWSATHALAALDGIATPQRRQGDWGWPWNGIATNADGSPNNARIGAIVKDFFTNFPLTQDFADQYGLKLNVAKMRSQSEADWYAAVPEYGSGSIANGGNGASNLGLQPAYAGNLRDFGSGPVATGGTTSKGMEYEVNAQITKDWSFTLNASKTDAKLTSVSPSIDSWVATYTKFLAGDAGLIRLWGGDTMRKNWQDNILSRYNVLKAQIGLSAPEIAKWRYNTVTNYNFSSGPLKGSNVGLAYRWEGKKVLGYKYSAAKDSLDVSQPWHGPSEDHIDLWAGYGRKLTKKINWRVQLNLRDVGEKNRLVPVNINPDGTVALGRIQDGMSWQLTNTLEF